MSPWRSVTSVFHPTDFSPESEVAFVHALRLALSLSAQLRLMHVAESKEQANWAEFPHVRATLAAWGLLPPDAARQDVVKLGLDVEKILAVDEPPKEALLSQLEFRPPTLMVLATYQLSSLARLVSQTIAEPIARDSGVPTLFIPAGHPGFVSPANGSVTLQHVLIPIDHTPDPQLAVDAAVALALMLRLETMAFRLLHVGPEHEFPQVDLPAHDRWTWDRVVKEGGVVDAIVAAATEERTDLLVMATQGHVGLVDALFGSTTERVLRQVCCPVFAIAATATSVEQPPLAVEARRAAPTIVVSPTEAAPQLEEKASYSAEQAPETIMPSAEVHKHR